MEFLKDAHRGISINLLVTRQPDRICWSAACPFGIGGYSITGRSWRIRIPKASIIYGNKRVGTANSGELELFLPCSYHGYTNTILPPTSALYGSPPVRKQVYY